MMKVPIFTLQNLLGHAQIETTMIYSHLAIDHKDEEMGKLPY
jgi:site-specific recombinase XerD